MGIMKFNSSIFPPQTTFLHRFPPFSIYTGTYRFLSLGDYNGDGFVDCAVATHRHVYSLENDGGDGFSLSSAVELDFNREARYYVGSLSSGYFNGDQYCDLLIMTWQKPVRRRVRKGRGRKIQYFLSFLSFLYRRLSQKKYPPIPWSCWGEKTSLMV